MRFRQPPLVAHAASKMTPCEPAFFQNAGPNCAGQIEFTTTERRLKRVTAFARIGGGCGVLQSAARERRKRWAIWQTLVMSKDDTVTCEGLECAR